MLVEVQPGTYLNPDDVVAIVDDGFTFHQTRYDRSYVTVRSGAQFRIDRMRADEVRAILWPDDNKPRQLAE